MPRSKWKGPNVTLSFSVQDKHGKPQRSQTILPSHVGKEFMVYNGKSSTRLTISFSMIGHKFGEFSLTRQACVHTR